MANQPSIDNVQRALRVQRDLDAKIQKKFRVDDKMTIKDSYIVALMYATRGVELDAADHEKIAADKRAAKANIKKGRAI